MKSKVKVLWIDDDCNRQEDAKNLSSGRIEVTWLHPEDFQPRSDEPRISAAKKPDIFLVDFYLQQHGKEGGDIFPHLGLTMGAIIRETFPESPIYLVSARETENDGVKLEQWAPAAGTLFDRMLSLKEIQREGQTLLYYDAIDYDLIRKTAGKGLESLLRLLHARNQDTRNQLTLVLPDGLREGVNPPEMDETGADSIGFGRWVKDILMTAPGLLYKEVYAATFLGMTLEGFQKLAPQLEDARYSGVFSRTYPKVWWSSILRKTVLSRARATEVNSADPWKVAPVVFETARRYHSKCAVCSKEFPETVGINAQDASDLRPVHYGCSEPHPGRKKELYFDEPRIFILAK